MRIRHFYLIMAIIGTAIPGALFARFFATHGFDIPLFLRSLFANDAAGGFSADVLISIPIFWVWSWFDARWHGITRWWLVLPTSCFVGLSLSLPLYLYMRTGKR